MSRLLVPLFSIVVFGGFAADPNTPEEISKAQSFDAEKALKGALRKRYGFTEDQLDTLTTRLWSRGDKKNKWPYTDNRKALFDSVNNPANNNAGLVAEAITASGGNPSDMNSLSEEVQTKCKQKLANSEHRTNSSGSLLQVGSGLAIAELAASLSMMAGNVGTNTASLAALSTTAAANSLAITEIGTAVGAMSSVTAPTIALAGTLGVPISTVASLALAGSFVGPMLGVIALVYAAWPEEEVDPWLLVESRVAKTLSARFDAKRRTRLGDRQRRYIKQFSRCSQAWVSSVMTNVEGVTIPRWLVNDADKLKQMVKDGGDFSFDSIKEMVDKFPAPRCMAQLEGQMSIERDEWYDTDRGSFSGLFMPFANMHTQLLAILADNPFDKKMQWDATLKATSAEYGNYLLGHLLGTWKAQVCRSMRLRHSMAGPLSWKYQYIAMKVMHQPNAGKDCASKCGSGSGWCAWCGGKNVGACCQKGDKDGVCKMFDTPVGWHGSKYKNCVHVDCIQSNSGYYGKDLKKIEGTAEGGAHTAIECQGLCQSVEGASFFSLNKDGMECRCVAAGAKRHFEEGASSGPISCKKEESLAVLEEKLEEGEEENTKVPMEPVEPCDKSPVVGNYAELEESHPEWVKSCYTKAAKVLVAEYNTFYLKFGKFVDSLAWKAGCGLQREMEWVRSERGDNYLEVSNEFDGGSFSDCNWRREEKNDESMWIFDETQARGWTGTSRVNMDEQKAAKMQYPMPAWLHDLRNSQECMLKTMSGSAVDDPSDGRSSSVGTIMQPTTNNDDLEEVELNEDLEDM